MNVLPSQNSVLETLLGDFSTSNFFDDYYLRLPFSLPSRAVPFRHLGTWEVLREILLQPLADVLVGRGGERWKGSSCPSPDLARELLQQGFTIGARHVQRYHAGLEALAKDFENVFHAPVDIHLYGTAGGQLGFGWHYDAEEVFVLQTEGEKRWQLRKNTVNPWPVLEALPRNQDYERELMPVLDCSLSAGDWLYIPSGYWHATQAGNESFSLSIGIRPETALDLLDYLRHSLLSNLEWRQRLPVPHGSLSEQEFVKSRLQKVAAELGTQLPQLISHPDFLQAFQNRGRGIRHL